MVSDIWDPFEEMKKFRKQMDRMFESVWEKRFLPKKALAVRQPSADIEDKKKDIEITVELPGIDKKDIAINIEEDRIEIKAQRKSEKEIKKKDFYRQERNYSGFYRAFALPARIDPDKAKTSFSNGVLKLNLPKQKQLAKKSKTVYLK